MNFLKRKISIDALRSELKILKDMPGPKGFLGLGNIFDYTYFGKYSFDDLHKSGLDKYKKYGSIVHERMLPGVSVVWLYNPNDIAEIFNDGVGNWPCRRSHLALEKFRSDRPEIYRTGGILPTNGLEWWKLRSEFQKGLSSPQNVRNFLPHNDKITNEFIKELLPKRLNEQNIIQDFVKELERLSLELTCMIAFDERMNCFSEKELMPDSRTSLLIKAAEDSNSSVLPTDQGLQLWKFYETSAYRKLRTSQEYMQEVSMEFVKKRSNSKIEGNSLLEQYLKKPKINEKDIIGMLNDLLLGGIHTTSFSISFALHYISKEKRVQELLHEEAKRVLPNSTSPLTTSIMNSEIPYTRAVLKETFRLNPISVGVGRILNHDTVLSGYLVPKNTSVVTQNFVACRLEENFSNPLTFSPERWLKNSGQQKLDINPYLVIPFGHGSRACIARRFAEQAILVFLIRLMRDYKIDWKGSKEYLDIQTKLINRPADDVTIKFEKRIL